jgi:hypothetical protein
MQQYFLVTDPRKNLSGIRFFCLRELSPGSFAQVVYETGMVGGITLKLL